MSDIFFALLWGGVLLIPQSLIVVPFFGARLDLALIPLLVIYIGFNYTFFKGLIVVVSLSYFFEVLSFVPPGLVILTNVILFIGLQLLMDRVLSEAYVTKVLWVFLAYLSYQLLILFSFNQGGIVFTEVQDGLVFLVHALVTALLSFPLFIILDATYLKWQSLFSKKKAHLTGADFFEVKSSQRKYLR